MTIRYRIIKFDPSQQASALLAFILPASSSQSAVIYGAGGGQPWASVVAHLASTGVKTLVLQEDVRDQDFLEEHQAFYGRLHRSVPKTCLRAHAFTCEVGLPDPSNEEQVLRALDELAGLPDCYAGFVTIRPLRHAPVGATILSRPSGNLTIISDRFPVHIAGNELTVDGAPFLQQDNAVGACAQASIWMALRTVRRRLGNAAYSPAELTMAATKYFAINRVFPGRHGLILSQMLEAIRAAAHDPLHLSLRPKPEVPPTANEVLRQAVPYLDSGLPVIMVLFAPDGGHAVIALGQTAQSVRLQPVNNITTMYGTTFSHASPSDWADGLVIHNDNSGPYLDLKSQAVGGAHYTLEQTSSLIVTLPDDVYVSAAEAELAATKHIALSKLLIGVGIQSGVPLHELQDLKTKNVVLRVYLCPRHQFRKWAKDEPELDAKAKELYRARELPKNLWIVEIHDADLYNPVSEETKSRCGEVILDASADSLHGDCLVCIRLSGHFWDGVPTPFGSVVFDEDAQGRMSTISLQTGSLLKAFRPDWT